MIVINLPILAEFFFFFFDSLMCKDHNFKASTWHICDQFFNNFKLIAFLEVFYFYTSSQLHNFSLNVSEIVHSPHIFVKNES